jgi:TolB protein
MIYPLVQLFLRLLLLALLVITSALGAGALLPDGGQIAFESNADGDTDVYILDLRTRHLHNLTRTNPHYDGQPAWSPDGRRLAFVSLRNDGLGVEVFMMDASGRNVVQVSPGGSDGHAPAWSPQGDALAYVLGYNLLRLVELPDLRERALTRGYEPAFTPDGTQVTYAIVDDSFGTHIASIGLEAAAARFLTVGAITFDQPAWSPAGRYLAAHGYRGLEMYVYRLDGDCLPACQGQARLLSERQGISPAWSPDGAQVAFACLGVARRDLCIVPADGGTAQPITAASLNIYIDAPAWRP